MMEFFLRCVPPKTTHHAKKIVKVGKFSKLADKPELMSAKEILTGLLLPHVPDKPVAEPIALSIEYTWPWRQGDNVRIRSKGRKYYLSKPDCSNAAKTLEDLLMHMRFIPGDEKVADLRVKKFRGDEPGIRIKIETLGE
jgi:Holliday junction resolvase RusA-like endonuclease